jgi:phosphate transport system substrate-binding protein
MSTNERRTSKHPETILACALLAGTAGASSEAGTATTASINGGGDTLGGEALSGTAGEFALYNTSKVAFGTYWEAGSGISQRAFIYNDLTCDIDAVTGANGGACVGPDGGAGNTVDYALAEEALTAIQVSTWATSSFGQSSAGNLIQIPAFGIAPAIAVNNSAITENGELELSDNDLCGIYSGLITDFSQITDSATAPAAGAITLVYRSDASVLSFLLTNHLNAVCKPAHTQSGITFTATPTFASLFPGGINTWIPNAIGESGDAGVADYLSGLTSGPVPSALGYVSTGWTSLYSQSQTALTNGAHSTLLVAALKAGKEYYEPTNANVATGLLSPKAGTGVDVSPPANETEGANPELWVPLVPTVSKGYPLVGYTEFVLTQCYKSAAVGKGVVAFLKDHYGKASYEAIQNANGFVTIKQVKANGYLAAIQDNILANDDSWNVDVLNPTACAGLPGR